MKRFALFACDRYYPVGGMDDFIKSFDTYEEAEKYIEKIKEGKGEGKAAGETYDFYEIEDMSKYE